MFEGTGPKRLKAAWLWCAYLLLLPAGCRENVKSALSEAEYERITATREASDPDVLVVGGDTVTCEQVMSSPMQLGGTVVSLRKYLEPTARATALEQFKQRAAPQLQRSVLDRISNTLLYQAAKRDAGEKIDAMLEKAADREMRAFVQRFEGDDARAEAALREMGMNRKSFIEYVKRSMLTQSFLGSKSPDARPITHSELLSCYDQMKDESFMTPGMVRFRLIDINAAKIETTDPNQDRMSRAKELAKELASRMRAGEDFGELAKQYSHGHRAEFGGLWDPRDPDSLAQPYDVLAANAEKMRAGQIAGPIEVAGHIFILKLEDKRPKSYEPLDKVQQQVEQKIIADRSQKALYELEARIRQQAMLIDTRQFVESCLDKIHKTYNP